MKRIFFWVLFLALAALYWAALHDILKGEPNLWMERGVVIASALLLAYTPSVKFTRRAKSFMIGRAGYYLS